MPDCTVSRPSCSHEPFQYSSAVSVHRFKGLQWGTKLYGSYSSGWRQTQRRSDLQWEDCWGPFRAVGLLPASPKMEMRQNVEVDWKHLNVTLSTSRTYQERAVDAVSAVCRFTLMIRANASEPKGLHWESVSVMYECTEISTADPWSPLWVCGVSTGVYLSFLGIPRSPTKHISCGFSLLAACFCCSLSWRSNSPSSSDGSVQVHSN